MGFVKQSCHVNGLEFTLETGKMAKQASSVVIQLGETVVIATAAANDTPRADIDFFPLTCDYVEKVYAAGRIPGGFFKREGRPSEKEVLTSRLIDRPIRPMFSDDFRCETQIISYVLSTDTENMADVLAMTAASAALTISDIPFMGPLVGIRVGRIDGKFIAYPTKSQLANSDMDMILSVSRDSIIMVEGGFSEASELDVLAAMSFASTAAKPLLDLQESLQKVVGKAKRETPQAEVDLSVESFVRDNFYSSLQEAFRILTKKERRSKISELKSQANVSYIELNPDADPLKSSKKLAVAFEKFESDILRNMILDEGRRIDGRSLTDIRNISIEVGVLPRTHGSALFTRGETQVLAVSTLGTSDDAQRIDSLEGDATKTFTLHYNFPPFSVGEVRPVRSPGRREVGHGALAERSLRYVAPTMDKFPYTIRIVSEVLESNGSSSMASVCGGTLCLLDAGVPIKASVAGIAMGLIKEGEKFAILSDILGDEDHLGDMDFKVAGTNQGVTAFQMDTKIKGVSMEIMQKALEQARQGRLFILGKMEKVIVEPRSDLSRYAPRITTLFINTEKIRDVIGPGGKVIRGIIEKTGVKIDIDDTGKVTIASPDQSASAKAERMVRELTQEAEVGKLYLGQVKKITDFGAFVEIFPGTEGLLHISQLAKTRVRNVTDVVNEGDEILVKVLEVDKSGKIRLSRKDALKDSEEAES